MQRCEFIGRLLSVEIMSPKAIFVTLCTVCLVGICVYFVDVNTLTSQFVSFTNSQLATFNLILTANKINFTEEETVISLNDTQPGFHLQTTSSSFVIAQVNNGSKKFTREQFPNVTTMRFNSSLIVQCKESPYVVCSPPYIQPLSNKMFKIVYLRRPVWLSLAPSGCNLTRCVVSDGPVTNDTDIVVVYSVGLSDNFQPPQRWPNQTYVISGWESPVHTRSDVLKNARSPWNARINLIMSYRVNADIFHPYNQLIFSPKPLTERPDYYKIAQKKTRTAAWMVSNCRTPSRREKYVKEMQKYIDVDIFGGCGKPCSKSDLSCNDWATRYKFYLAFENSLCTDYVTEKFFKLFNQTIHVIPVVRGGADYDKHLPNFTYINSAHFKTPKDLALYLKHLASDLETYSKFLEYKDLFKHNDHVSHACKLCSFARTHQFPATKTYNLKQWLNDGHCHSPTDL